MHFQFILQSIRYTNNGYSEYSEKLKFNSLNHISKIITHRLFNGRLNCDPALNMFAHEIIDEI
jgi:hypothetical protein